MSVQRAREAAARGDCEEAYDVLVKADAGGLARPDDLRFLGEVAYASGHLDVSIEAWERAHALSERDFLVRELAAAVGLGGRDRRAASVAERARSGVTRAIRQAIARIREHHPQLAEHIDRAVRTGTYCAYVPDPGERPAWSP